MMPTVRMLCLASSAKHNGRCVAGIRLDTQTWIRPVSAAEDGTLSTQACALDAGREIRPLDVVELHLAMPRPERHQPENWVVGPGRWQLVDEWSVGEAADLLDRARESGPQILGGTGSRIDLAWIEAHGVATSLAVVRVSAPKFGINIFKPNRLRALFSLRGQSYDLSVSDLAPWVEEARLKGGISPGTDWYLTISLTEPFAMTNACHKLVAAGIEIG